MWAARRNSPGHHQLINSSVQNDQSIQNDQLIKSSVQNLISLTCTAWETRRFPAASQRRFSAIGWPRTGGGSKSFFPPSFKQKRWSSGVLKRAVIFVWIQTSKSIKARKRHLALLHLDRLEVVLDCWGQVWRYLLVDHHLIVSIVLLLKQHFGGRIIVLEGLCEGWRFTSAFEKLSYPSLPFPR